MELNLEALNKGTGNEFITQIQNVPRNLNENNLNDFYGTCLNLLNRDDLSRLSHSYVLQAIISAISVSQGNLEAFIECNIPSRLPYKQLYLQEKLLDIIFLIATYSPHGINKRVAYMFSHIIGRYPRKCLTILSIYAERFQIVLDPWPMLDLLFKYQDYFCNDEGCTNDYLSVLVYLNTNFSEFGDARQQHSWYAVTEIIKKRDEAYLNQLEQYESSLSSRVSSSPKSKARNLPPPKQDIALMANCYFALCHFAEANPKICSYLNFPIVAQRQLTDTPELQYPIISLLMRIPPNGCHQEVIKSLVCLMKEQGSKPAGVALASLAQNRNCAQILARNLYWLQNKNNENNINLTYRALSTVLEKPQFRRIVANFCNELILFLNQLLENSKDPQIGLISASTIVRRLPIDARVIFNLSRGGFLSKYYEKALSQSNSSNDDVARSTLQMTADLAQKGDAIEFDDCLCSFVDQCVKEKRASYNEEARKAAVYLAQHPRCSNEFKSLELNEYFRENQDSDDYANKFLENYSKSISRPVTSPLTPERSPRSPRSATRSPFSSSPASPKQPSSPKTSSPITTSSPTLKKGEKFSSSSQIKSQNDDDYDDDNFDAKPLQNSRKSSSESIPLPFKKPPPPPTRRSRE